MKFIPNGLTRQVGRAILNTKKSSPHLAFGLGVVGAVGATVLACRATLQLETKVAEMEHSVAKVQRDYTNPSFTGVDNTSEHYKRDLVYAYGKGIYEITKLYAPSLIVGGFSIALLTGSHVQLTKRNAALTAAYATLHEATEAYRARVREEVGEEQEADLWNGLTEVEIETESGKKTFVQVADPNSLSPHARFFDKLNSTEWTPDPETNKVIVLAKQNYFNQLLQARGHVFLNEVYDELGLERSTPGQAVGWVFSPDSEGDNHIDFGIYNAGNSRFVNGTENAILLDFNVDGVIWDKI